MFKAYFYLSMELVRDVVKALEEEMMENFDDQASKPVSAVFTAPIQTNGNNGLPTKAHDDEDETEQYWPVMETMSQDAIDEMVEKTFSGLNIRGDGLISFEEFKAFVERDSTMIAWFEALGKYIFSSLLELKLTGANGNIGTVF
jgi:hypothetical protein